MVPAPATRRRRWLVPAIAVAVVAVAAAGLLVARNGQANGGKKKDEKDKVAAAPVEISTVGKGTISTYLETTTVLEADLGWIIGWKKGDFIGRAALEEQKQKGLTRKLVGLEMMAPGIARHGYKAYAGDGEGIVTSGTQTPLLKKAIGLAYLPIAATEIGTEFDVDIRGRRTRARVVARQFYKRSRS